MDEQSDLQGGKKTSGQKEKKTSKLKTNKHVCT
jgi:hypothetical protein